MGPQRVVYIKLALEVGPGLLVLKTSPVVEVPQIS